jgi:hypothetical protein
MKSQETYTAKDLIEMSKKLFSQFSECPQEDTTFFEGLINEFSSSMDIASQLKQFHAWCLDQHPTRIANIRFRFRGWLENGLRYSKSKQPSGSPYPFSSKKPDKN